MLHNRQWLLHRRPRGALALDDFELRATELAAPALAAGQILVRNRLFTCAPTMRTWMNEPGRTHRSIALGTPILGPGGAEVVASRHPRFPVGTQVTLLARWEDYSVLEPDASPTPILAQPPDVALIDAMGLYGLNSCTAYFGLVRVAQVRAGDTVVISAAAGAVGSTAVQIARLLGARVIGIAGGPAKCALVIDELGADAAIDYKHDDVGARLAALCPGGVDVFFDNVGGDLLDAVLDHIASHGRIALCGQVAAYDTGGPARGPRDMMPVIYRSVTIRGFVMSEFLPEVDAALVELRRWAAQGRLVYRTDVRRGFAELPRTFLALFQGDNRGMLVVEADDP